MLLFLRVEINSRSLQLCLPELKLAELYHTLERWHTKTSCTKQELLSLVGQLHHASAVIKPGRTFLRQLIDLSTTVKKLHRHIRLTNSARSDIEWWHSFLAIWNGISYLPPTEPHEFIESDASGSCNLGVPLVPVHGPDSWQNVSIAAKELLPILLAVVLWGKEWTGRSVRCWSDNAAVVAVVNTGWCQDKHLMHLMRCLFFYDAHFRFGILARHIAGVANTKADALSRGKL